MTLPRDIVKFLEERSINSNFVSVVQREPYSHNKTKNGIVVERNVGGVHVLLDRIMRITGGTMFSVGSGSADKETVDKKGLIRVPPHRPSYLLRRVFLSQREYFNFYYGFSNQTIWPLSHSVFVRPKFNSDWWKDYYKVNKKFAKLIINQVRSKKAIIWINDYHFYLLPRMLKDEKPEWKIGFFSHIPWPTQEIFRICPWEKEILRGILGADFLSFHRGYHVDNFIDCVRKSLESMVKSEPLTVFHKNNKTHIRALSAGVDYNEIVNSINGREKISFEEIKKETGAHIKRGQKIIVSIDRADYTKGITERMKIIEKFFRKYPYFIKKIVFLFFCIPSRTLIADYSRYRKEIKKLAVNLNSVYGTKDWQPICLVEKTFPRSRIFDYYRIADVCMVTSLDDGMNLVSKEYISCTDSSRGMLVISQFAGAARDLEQAVSINPYDYENSATALKNAIVMNSKEKEKRNNKMKEFLSENNIYKWGLDFLKGIYEV